MKIAFFVDLSILLIMFLVLSKKTLSTLENIFIILILEIFFSSYYAILISNTNVWSLSTKTEFIVLFRLLELFVMPLMILLYLNLAAAITSKKKRMIFTIVSIFTLYLIESLLVKWRVVTYSHWSMWQSILVMTVLLFVSTLLQRGFKGLMKREEFKGLMKREEFKG